MPVALFGKTQTKRDFIAPGAPRAFLDVWEPWMQAGLATSRMLLDRAWQQSFLTAPIWRFWMGEAVMGQTCLGAFMPSLDSIGRYYPLAAIATPARGLSIPPPELDLQESWFAAIEDFLLATLDPGQSWEAITAGLAALPEPALAAPAAPAPGMRALGAGFAARLDAAAPGEIFADLRRADWGAHFAGRSFFWTAGGEGFAPLAVGCRGLPPAEAFTLFLTGDFSAAGAAVPA
ncbi:MAG: type VI secretion system-associated protein TagF [Methylobacteriaceae bacterium]|nr:type VI secretion system-associated protein TagF [Methylobacteriaceae bacterium]